METECDSSDSAHSYGIICLLLSRLFFFFFSDVYCGWNRFNKQAREGTFMHKGRDLAVPASRWVGSHDDSGLSKAGLPVPREMSYLNFLRNIGLRQDSLKGDTCSTSSS